MDEEKEVYIEKRRRNRRVQYPPMSYWKNEENDINPDKTTRISDRTAIIFIILGVLLFLFLLGIFLSLEVLPKATVAAALITILVAFSDAGRG